MPRAACVPWRSSLALVVALLGASPGCKPNLRRGVDAPGGAAPSPRENAVPEVQVGNQTVLGSSKDPFAYYIAQMHRKIHETWAWDFLKRLDTQERSHPLNNYDLWTRLEIVLDHDGRVDKVMTVRLSGNTAFDEAAQHSALGSPRGSWVYSRERQRHTQQDDEGQEPSLPRQSSLTGPKGEHGDGRDEHQLLPYERQTDDEEQRRDGGKPMAGDQRIGEREPQLADDHHDRAAAAEGDEIRARNRRGQRHGRSRGGLGHELRDQLAVACTASMQGSQYPRITSPRLPDAIM